MDWQEEEVVILHEQLSLYQHHFGSDIAFDDKKMLEHGDRDQRIEPPDVGPSSFKTQKNDRKPEEDIGTVTANDAILTAGSVVTPHSSDLTDGVTHSQRLIVPPSDSGSSCSSSALSVPSTDFISSPGSSVTCQVAYPGLSASLSTETVFSRPSSAPGLVAAPGASFPMVQQVHPAPPLARSASATGRLGITAGEPTMSTGPVMQQSPPVTPSYRNAAVGVIRSNSMVAHSLASVSSVSNGGARSQGGSGSYPYLSGGYTHGPSHPLSGSNCLGDLPALVSTKLSGNESQTEAICEVMENLSAHRSDHGQRSMGFTFGTVTPEMIHLQHQQDQQRECADGSLQYMELDVQRQDYLRDQQLQQQTVDKKEMPHIIQHQVYTRAHEAQKNNRILQQDLALNARAQLAGGRLSLQMAGEAALSAGPVSEEFPHLDIINDLLDDEKIYGAKALNAFLQQPGNQGFQQLSFQELHNMCSGGPLHPEIHSIQGNGPERIDRGRPCDEGGRSQLSIPSDHTHSGLRESIQLLHTYPHPPLPCSFSQHGGLLDGVSGQHWTGAHGDAAVTSCANGVRSGMDVFVGYPMQSAHLPIADCPTFTMGQNGYTMYSPLKHP